MYYSLEQQRPVLQGDEHYVAPNATLIGAVVLHQHVSIWFNAVLRGDNEPIVVGEASNIQDGSVLHTDPGYPLSLGRGVTVGHMVMLHGCRIGDNTLIGVRSVVLNGARIGNNCLVGAGSLVTEGREIPDNSLVMGSPAKVVRTLDAKRIDELRQSARIYVKKLQRYRQYLQQVT